VWIQCGPRGGDPSMEWIRCSPRGRGPGGVWICHGARALHGLRCRDPGGGGGGAWIQCGAVTQCSQGAESLAEWSSSSAGLQGGDFAGRLFFYWILAWRSLPRSKGSECRIFGSLWCFTSAKCVSSISTGSLVHELTRSAALSPSPS
jgi:hypothetical protein